MIVLDTNALIWLFFDDGKLGRTARRAIDEAWSNGNVAVSAISFWEIALLHEKGRMDLATDFTIWRTSLFQAGLQEIAVDGAIGIKAVQLPNFHKDPADRIIVATALNDHRLVTADERILQWPGNLRCLDARK